MANTRPVRTVAPRVGPPEFVADVFLRAGFPGARPGGVENPVELKLLHVPLLTTPSEALELGLLEKKEGIPLSVQKVRQQK